MVDEALVRELLIDSCHSSSKAQRTLQSRLDDEVFVALLCKIARDVGLYGGDAPMQAAVYLSKAPPRLIANHEDELIAMLPEVDGYGGHIALSLGRIGSARAKPLILNELADGSRFDAWLFYEALRHYEDTSTDR